MDALDITYFTNIVIPGKTYRISEFICIKTDTWQQTLANKTSLALIRFATKFDVIEDVGFPNHFFDFISYNQLPYRVVDTKDKTKKPHPVLTGKKKSAYSILIPSVPSDIIGVQIHEQRTKAQQLEEEITGDKLKTKTAYTFKVSKYPYSLTNFFVHDS